MRGSRNPSGAAIAEAEGRRAAGRGQAGVWPSSEAVPERERRQIKARTMNAEIEDELMELSGSTPKEAHQEAHRRIA